MCLSPRSLPLFPACFVSATVLKNPSLRSEENDPHLFMVGTGFLPSLLDNYMAPLSNETQNGRYVSPRSPRPCVHVLAQICQVSVSLSPSLLLDERTCVPA